MTRIVPLVVAASAFVFGGVARADPPSNPYAGSSPPGAPLTIATPPPAATGGIRAETRAVGVDESIVARARELLARARFLDEAAVADEKAAADLSARLPGLRAAAKSARERADKARDAEKDTFVARAEDLEAEVAISELELATKKRAIVEDRRVARDLRMRAVRLVRETPSDEVGASCDPPFRYTPDGRKIYRAECLR